MNKTMQNHKHYNAIAYHSPAEVRILPYIVKHRKVKRQFFEILI